MIDILKYLVLSLTTLLLFEGAGEVSHNDKCDLGEPEVVITADGVSFTQQGLCLITSSQLSSTGSVHQHSGNRRHENNSRNNYECEKSARRAIFNIRHTVQEKSLIHNYMLMERADILAKFCKLII